MVHSSLLDFDTHSLSHSLRAEQGLKQLDSCVWLLPHQNHSVVRQTL